MMFDHGKHPMIGTIPIATISHISEDGKGLFVRARLADNWLVQPVREALSTGAVKGMSIRATVIKDAWHPNVADRIVERSISEVALHELGPVVFPAYDETTVSVRSRKVYDELADPAVQREVARMLLAGVPVVRSTAARPQPGNARSKRISALQRRARLVVAEGAAMSPAVNPHPDMFLKNTGRRHLAAAAGARNSCDDRRVQLSGPSTGAGVPPHR